MLKCKFRGLKCRLWGLKSRLCRKVWAVLPVRLGRNSGRIPEKNPETLSELEYGWDPPKPYNSRHLRLPEHFQNSLPPQYGWGRLFFQKWFRRGPLRAGRGIPSSTGGISENKRNKKGKHIKIPRKGSPRCALKNAKQKS